MLLLFLGLFLESFSIFLLEPQSLASQFYDDFAFILPFQSSVIALFVSTKEKTSYSWGIDQTSRLWTWRKRKVDAIIETFVPLRKENSLEDSLRQQISEQRASQVESDEIQESEDAQGNRRT